MITQPYSDPVRKLLEIGFPEEPWPDYPAQYGLTEADIPELIRLVNDTALRWEETTEDEGLKDEDTLPEWCGQIHAWRTLAQLQAVEAIPTLINLLQQVDELDDDWWEEEAGDVFSLLGVAAIAPLSVYIADASQSVFARITAAGALRAMAQRHPETRPECIQGIVNALKNYEQNDESVNGFLVLNLTKLKAVDQIDLIEQAFRSDRVDDFVMGDFEDVQVKMGLLPERKTHPFRRSFSDSYQISRNDADLFLPITRTRREADKKKKAKRKQEKLSRKKNRKKK
jgi:hypothetical protein